MDVQTTECQFCGRGFYPRIGEQFCSPAHAKEYFSRAARTRDSRRSDTKANLTGRHRVMDLLRLAPVAVEGPPEPPPLQLRLAPIGYDPPAFPMPESRALTLPAEAIGPPRPFVVKLPTRTEPVGVEHGLQALASAIAARAEADRLAEEAELQAVADAANRLALLPLAMPAPKPPGGRAAVSPPTPERSAAPSMPCRKRGGLTPTKIRRAKAVEFFSLRPAQGGARIFKQQPLAAPWPENPVGRPLRGHAAPAAGRAFCEILYPVAPFREVPSEAPAASKSGQHLAGQPLGVRWEFLHELEEGPTRLESKANRAPGAAAMQRESVEPWLVPPRPMHPARREELRPFDWAQLTARLADFEPPACATGAHGATTLNAVAARRRQQRLLAIPVVGPVLHFWQCQTWAVRSLTLAIPVLAFIAVKPSLDGSLREPPVVLAKGASSPKEISAGKDALGKDMPPAARTVVRMLPSRKPAVAAAPVMAGKEISAGAAKPASAANTPKLVAERQAKGARGAGDLPVATVSPKLDNFDRMLLSRAAIELADDFSYGLDSWEARSNAVQWTYDTTGFIRPKGLALYRPSMNLADYSVEFLAKIDSAAISWVIRAQDLNNYHVVKLVQRGGGPLPRYTVMRYAVVNGREGPRIERPLPLNLYKDTLFRIRMDIRGSNFAVMVQDSVVDSWSDERFPTGGVGFFTGLGEDARIRWVQVTYQNDFLGRVCAWLAPKGA